jgi:hypothetical protein
MQSRSAALPPSRDSRFELLRIVSLVLIIAHHYSVYGGFEFDHAVMGFNRLLVQFLFLGGKIGVNCFVLITGYFMITSDFSLKKCAKIVLEVYFYSILFLLVGFAAGVRIPVRDLIKNLLPLTSGQYWFMTTYVVLYICTPVLNTVTRSLSRGQHLRLILVALFLWCVLPSFTTFVPAFSQTLWFFTLYEIAAYIRLYQPKIASRAKLNAAVLAISYALLVASVLLLDLLGVKYEKFANQALFFAKANALPTFVCSLSLFLAFMNLKPIHNKLINRCAGSMLGVYLIHENGFMRQFIWDRIFRNSDFAASNLLFAHALATILIVFLASLALDMLRIAVTDRPVSLLIERLVALMCAARRKARGQIAGMMRRLSS